jgi:serine/threonine protein kinase
MSGQDAGKRRGQPLATPKESLFSTEQEATLSQFAPTETISWLKPGASDGGLSGLGSGSGELPAIDWGRAVPTALHVESGDGANPPAQQSLSAASAESEPGEWDDFDEPEDLDDILARALGDKPTPSNDTPRGSRAAPPKASEALPPPRRPGSPRKSGEEQRVISTIRVDGPPPSGGSAAAASEDWDDVDQPLAPAETAHIAQAVRGFSTEGGFEMRGLIGRGGQGEVFKAWQASLQREVAVKLATSGNVADFLQEAYTSAELDHPNIVPVHELGHIASEEKEIPMLAMKLVRGVPWNEQIAADRKSPDFAPELFLAKHLAVMVDVCNAVAYAHSKRIIHRDLKPSQVMVGEYGEVFLMDWGLALSLTEKVAFIPRKGIAKHRTRKTAINRCGSPGYMAPEQTEETTANLGVHTDVYLLGAILYQLVMDKPPHHASTAMEAFDKARRNQFDNLPADCSPYLKELINVCLATDPARRPSTVKELREKLQSYLSGADRRRESERIVTEVDASIRQVGDQNLGYEHLSQLNLKLLHAQQLWPENTRAKIFQSQILRAHVTQALKAGDLHLARTLAQSLPESEPKRLVFLQEVARIEIERDRKRHADRRRRVYMLGFFALAALTLAAVAVWTINDARSQAREAASEKDAAIEQADLRQQLAEKASRLGGEEDKIAAELASVLSVSSLAERIEETTPTLALDPAAATKLRQRMKELASERQKLAAGSAAPPPVSYEFLLAQASFLLADAPTSEQALRAAALFEEAARRRESDPEPWRRRALALSRAGQSAEAAQSLEEAGRRARALLEAREADLKDLDALRQTLEKAAAAQAQRASAAAASVSAPGGNGANPAVPAGQGAPASPNSPRLGEIVIETRSSPSKGF